MTFIELFSSMKTKIVISFAFLLLVLTIIINVVLSSYYREEFKEIITNQQITYLSLIAVEISRDIEQAEVLLREISKNVTSEIITDPEITQEFLDGWMREAKVFNNGIFILSKNGTRIAETPFKPGRRGIDLSERQYFQAVMEHGKVCISDPYISTQSHHHPSIMIACPIFNARGEIIAVMEGGIDLYKDSFLKALSLIRIGKTGYISLYSADGMRIMHPDRTLIMKISDDSRLTSGFEGAVETESFAHVKILRVYKRVSATNWIVTVNYPVKEAYKAVIFANRVFFIIGAFIVLMVGIVTWLILVKLFQPIIVLTSQVKMIGSSPDQHARVTFESKGELGILADNINLMLEEIDSTELDLQKSEKNLDITINSIGEGVIATDSAGRVVRLNPVAEQLTGWSADNAKGKSIDEIFIIIDELNREPAISPLIRITDRDKDGGQIDNVVLVSKHHSESVISYNCSPIKASNGVVNGAVIVFRDITEERKVLRKLNFQATILDNMTDIIFCCDMNGTITYVSPSLLKCLTDDSQNLIGADVWDIYGESIIGCDINEIIERTKSEGWSGDVQLVKDGGDLVYMSIQTSVVPDTDGTPSTLICVARNVTESRNAEKERNFMALAVEQAAEAVCITNIHGIIEYVNPAFECITGFPHDETIANNIDMLGNHDDSSGYESIWEQALTGELWSGHQTLTKRNGNCIETHTTVSPVRDAEGRMTNFLVLISDVTFIKKLETKLLQAQKLEAIGTLAGGIAHDFNNILFAIVGYTEMALSMLPGNSSAGKNLAEVMRASNRAKDLIRQILAFSRQIETERIPIQLTPIVKETLKLLQSALPKNIEVRLSTDRNCGVILADPTQIYQVIMNLCTNAYYAMRDNGGVLFVNLNPFTADSEHVRIHPSLKEGDYVLLTVQDTGTGMGKLILDRIFEPYFSTKPPGEGTGLGLATVHGIVTHYDGYISVTSEPGMGTTFNIYFPLYKEETIPENVIRMDIPGGTERVLVVDDEQLLVHLIEKILVQLGYTVTAVDNSLQAFEIFASNPGGFDLVITDYMMPDMNGIAMSRAIKSIREDIPIILISGYGDLVNEKQTGGTGIENVIIKPVLSRELAVTIRKALVQQNA